jgi:hypothetical protein
VIYIPVDDIVDREDEVKSRKENIKSSAAAPYDHHEHGIVAKKVSRTKIKKMVPFGYVSHRMRA